jgi:hypothetical protein
VARKPKLVLFADGINWLSPKFASEKTGLTKPELAKRAIAGEIRFKEDWTGKHLWYALPDIDPLRAANLAKKMTKKPTKRRPKSMAQLEREWASGPKLNEIPSKGIGPVAAHLEKVMLKEIEANRKKGGN